MNNRGSIPFGYLLLMQYKKQIAERPAAEAEPSLGWHKYVTDAGDIIGINKFGESAPGKEVMKEYGFTVENVVNRAKALLAE